LNTFNQAGADKGLTFSSQEVLTEKIIGLDGLHHKLLIFEFNNSNAIMHINLDDVKNWEILLSKMILKDIKVRA